MAAHASLTSFASIAVFMRDVQSSMQSKTTNNEDLHRPRIGVDLLGCDTPGEKILHALLEHKFKGAHPPKLTLFGTPAHFSSQSIPEDITCVEVTEEITANDDPLSAVRLKKDSSLIQGIQQVQSYDLDAFISAGNTGALLAGAKLKLKMLPGIDRPALLTLIPTKLQPVAVVDVGANVSVKAENLFQFAKMGIAYQKNRGIAHPTVGLLNIGEEEKKGTPELRRAYELLQILNEADPIDTPTFLGNIEGRDVFRGNIDVLVTDGFTGNVFLKTSEGIASFVLDEMQNLSTFESIPGLKNIFTALRNRLSYAEYPGALFCGVEGVIMKCHGSSPPSTFITTISSASHLVQHFFLNKIKNEL